MSASSTSAGPSPSPGTAVVTLNAGRDRHLLGLVEGLRDCDPAPSELVVVGMGTEAQPVAEVERLSPDVPVRWVDLRARAGPLPLARARNAGAAATSCSNLIFLDVDCIPAPDLVGAYAAALRSPGVAAGPVRYLERFWDHDLDGGVPRPELLHSRSGPHSVRPVPVGLEEDARHELLWSVAFGIRHDDFDAIGGFDEAYVGYGAEDTDLGYRARAAGLPMRWLPDGTAFHQWHPVSDPPVEHVDAIVDNACRFHQRWGRWPMEGWLSEFAARTLVDWDPDGRTLRRTGVPCEPLSPRVVAIPSTHPYTRRVLPDDVRCDRDPTRPWWPHRALEPRWIEQHVGAGDVVHLHFGFEHRTADEMAEWCRAVHTAGGALVVTVHDIDNPHLDPEAQGPHWQRTGIVLDAADAVVTLTPAAAQEVAHRWGRTARVVPHPHVAAVDHRPAYRSDQAVPLVVGIDLKALRSGLLDADKVLSALGEAAGRADATAVAWVEDDVSATRLETLSRRALDAGVDLRIERTPDDADLVSRFASLDVAVLPYRTGTHSGLLELCRDVGTRPVVPASGCYHDQWCEAVPFPVDPEGNPEALSRAILRALELGPVPVDRPGWRQQQLSAIRRAHSEVYRTASAGVGA